jgi:hypothetical protein
MMNRQTERPRMNRRLLVSLMAFGAVITLVGAAGIFAVFTDERPPRRRNHAGPRLDPYFYD